MLTSKQHQLLLFINQRLTDSGVSPSFDEMKDALGLKSKSGVHRLINALEERGFIRRMANRARALEVLRLPDTQASAEKPVSNVVSGNFGSKPTAAVSNNESTVDIPLHGRIAAGTPIEALENQGSYVPIPSSMMGRGDCYALEISGDSMIELGILDGDTVVIESGSTARDGEVVVALVKGEEATLKTLQRKGHHIALIPANNVQIQGRLVGLMRQYH